MVDSDLDSTGRAVLCCTLGYPVPHGSTRESKHCHGNMRAKYRRETWEWIGVRVGEGLSLHAIATSIDKP